MSDYKLCEEMGLKVINLGDDRPREVIDASDVEKMLKGGEIHDFLHTDEFDGPKTRIIKLTKHITPKPVSKAEIRKTLDSKESVIGFIAECRNLLERIEKAGIE